jgi:radical SAM superfamily enzyme YgiQ (UPF0313 family)
LLSRPIRLLLINPRFPESFWSFRWALTKVLPGRRALNPPLGLATLAALCPPTWQVQIVDENIESLPTDFAADIVGICGMAVQFPRQRELLRFYRRRGHYVVAGGSYASLCPERYRDLADTVVAGEAEYIWPRFCRDFEHGEALRFYQESGVVDLAHSPVPRFDLLKLDHYTTASVQFSRGCPYRCEFCDIIVMFGRRPRTKDPMQVERELDALRAAGVRNVFFVDDNLIGNRPKAKALLCFLADYQRRHRYQFQFGTEVSLNLAEDEKLLRLLREAGFGWVFVGIESPDEESLREAQKTQNTRQDLLTAVRNIYRHGIDVLSGFIVGFDNDTLQTFDRQYRFIMESGIQVAMIGLLTALPRTPLYERLEREGRLLPGAEHGDNTRLGTNFSPKRMSYDSLVEGYQRLYQRLARYRDIAERIRNKVHYLHNPVYRGGYSWRQSVMIITKLFLHGLYTPPRLWQFVRTLVSCKPSAWRQVICDWIAGLAMRDYISRCFETDPRREHRVAVSTLAFLRRAFSSCLQRGNLEMSLVRGPSAPRLVITLRGAVDVRFYRAAAARRLKKLLRNTRATISLRLESFSAKQISFLSQLLQQLSHYGDRVSLHVNEKFLHLQALDLHAFRVVLEDYTS